MQRSELVIRTETAEDAAAIRRVHAAAFPGPLEGRLVDALRAGRHLTISLLAELGGETIAHVAFSPVTVEGGAASLGLGLGLGLGPLAVVPSWQRQGIGSRLVTDGLGAARQADAGFVVVLGDPAYYGRFGFQPAERWNLVDEYGGGQAFQALKLLPDALRGPGGLVRYSSEFALVAELGERGPTTGG